MCSTACSVQQAVDSFIRVIIFTLHSIVEVMCYFIFIYLLFCLPGVAVRAEGTRTLGGQYFGPSSDVSG